ncbi:ABC transporter ATP-binding protein [Actinopolymorpha sp. B17G11]|uniref:ABC transporter ATP-binding protein n=1 Tax=Actinopolymorpha sp. B17G11 TaxID=3160861 RepID=UPI0032E38F63
MTAGGVEGTTDAVGAAADADGEAVLAVRDLRASVSSGAGREVPIVRGVSFDVRAGETVALVGESGSGKSFTALALMGLLPDGARITCGSVRLGGRDLLGLDARARRASRGADIAMIYQDPMTSLNPLMRVGDQVVEGLEAHGTRGSAARRRTLDALAEVSLPDPERLARSYPHQLSGGQRQRVMIAMAVALRPRVLIADEPTTALDVTIQQQILTLVDSLARRTGLAVIWITHDLGVVARIARRVLVMYAGRLVESGPSRALFRTPQHPYTTGLLRSLPPMRGDERPPLPQVGGAPPDIAALPAGCAFHPRCPQRIDQCVREEPVLEQRGTNLAACWVPRGRWV